MIMEEFLINFFGLSLITGYTELIIKISHNVSTKLQTVTITEAVLLMLFPYRSLSTLIYFVKLSVEGQPLSKMITKTSSKKRKKDSLMAQK